MNQTFDFDQIIDRSGTNSVKYNLVDFGRDTDVLPLWVADMDFAVPPCVQKALAERVGHGIYGYSNTDDAYRATLKNWFSHRFGWEIEPNWLVKTPGVVVAVHLAIHALTKPGGAVLIQEPVYYPFRNAIERMERRLVVNELVYENGTYAIDFDDFEEKIRSEKVKLFILCSPHNPVGRVWRREELLRMGEICQRHGVLVVADEIHQDFVFPGRRHHVFASLDLAFADFTITCTAPSKTFNLAGLQLSNILISNQTLRRSFRSAYQYVGMDEPGLMGIVACQAAYSEGEPWLEELLAYLAGNVDFLRSYLQEHLPAVRLVEPDGTYLAWLDFKALGLEDEVLDDLISNRAKLWLDDGPMFGPAGSGFQRVNLACPRSVLGKALQRLSAALK